MCIYINMAKYHSQIKVSLLSRQICSEVKLTESKLNAFIQVHVPKVCNDAQRENSEMISSDQRVRVMGNFWPIPSPVSFQTFTSEHNKAICFLYCG